MGALKCWNNTLGAAQLMKSSKSLVICHRHILSTARIFQPAMLRPYARIIKARGDGMGCRYLPLLVLQKITLSAMKNALPACAQRCRMGPVADAMSCGFNANHGNIFVPDEGIKKPHGIAAAADAGQQIIRQAFFLLQELPTSFATTLGAVGPCRSSLPVAGPMLSIFTSPDWCFLSHA